MKTFLAVARREVAEKRFVLWAALVVATQPFAVPLVRGLSGNRGRDVRDMTAMLLGVGLAAAVAAGLGSSIFAGELAAKRMGFFFSRPISPAALWAGKLAGAGLLVASSFLIVALPTALVGRDRLGLRDTGAGIAIIAAGLAVLLLAMNFLSTMVRSRSWIAIADVVAAGTIALVLVLAWSKLRRWNYAPPEALIWLVGIAVAAGLLWSSYRAVSRGRTDLRSAHRALSAALWTVFGAMTAVLLGYAGWVLAAPPSALEGLWPSAVGGDGWVFLWGHPRGTNAGYLYDTRSSRYDRIPSEDVSASGDGRLAAWVEWDSSASAWALHTRRLDDAAARPSETKLSYRNHPYPLLVSPDGLAVAAVERGLLTVSDIRTGGTLASVRIGESTGWRSGAFLSPGRVRIVRLANASGGTRIESFDLDVASHGPAETHATEILTTPTVRGQSDDHRRLIVREGRCRRVTLRDAATLEVVATLRDGEPSASCVARFLEDGSIVLALKEPRGSRVETFSPEGAPRASIPLPAAGVRFAFGEQPSAGQVFLARQTLPADTPGGSPIELHLVDVRKGTAARIADDLYPIWEPWWALDGPIRPGSEISRLFTNGHGGALVRFDAATGERRVLLGLH